MKRSKKIHLVLITAALASCNRVIIPSQPTAGYVADASLTQTPDDTDSTAGCVCLVNNSDSNTISLYNPPGIYYYYYYGQPTGIIYSPGRIYRKGTFWRSHQFVGRGGFGKSSVSAAS